MPRQVTAYFALLGALVSGCGSVPICHDGEVVAACPAEPDREMAQAPSNGPYGLYRRADKPDDASPRAADGGGPANGPGDLHGLFRLKSYGPVGFERGEDGQLLAVIGEEKVPLPPGRYCWCALPESALPEIAVPGPTLSAGQKVVWVLRKAGETAGDVLLFVVVLAVVAGVLYVYLLAGGHPGAGVDSR